MITRTQVAKAAFWQLLFVMRGTSKERVRAASEEGLMLLRGFSSQQMQQLVTESLEPVLRPLVYDEALGLVGEHRARGEPSYIVSAALQEVVDAISDDLGFDGALGTVCEVEDGVYTGRGVRSLHGENKAAAVRELAAERGYRPRRVHGVLRQPHRSAVSRGRREAGRGQSRPRAATGRRRARMDRA